jgi:hypothetical protein
MTATAGYQPVLALWAEQDVIVADEFGDGNVPAGSGNRRVVATAIAALPEDHWKADRRETDAIRECRGQLPAERRHLEKRRGLAAPLSRHPHPPAPRRAAARRRPGAPLLHHQPLRPGRRLWPRPDPLAPAKGRHHRACPRRADERTRRRRFPVRNSPPMPLGGASTWFSTTCSRPTTASAYPRNFIPHDPNDCALCSAIPSETSSAMPVRPCSAALKRLPELSPKRRKPASPSNVPPEPEFEGPLRGLHAAADPC